MPNLRQTSFFLQAFRNLTAKPGRSFVTGAKKRPASSPKAAKPESTPPMSTKPKAGRYVTGFGFLLLGTAVWAIENTNVLENEQLQPLLLTANRFSNRLWAQKGIAKFQSSMIESVLAEEGVLLQDNSPDHGPVSLYFRGECNHGPDEPETIKKIIDELMDSGRSPPPFKLRDGPSGRRFNPKPTVTNPILSGLTPEIPELWSDGVIALSSEFERAFDYAHPQDSGILMLCAPNRIACMGDYAIRVPNTTHTNEWEYITPRLDAENIVLVLGFVKGQLIAVRENPRFFDRSDIQMKGDQQLAKLLTHLDPKYPEQQRIHHRLHTAVNPMVDYSKHDYEARENSNIYEAYARCVKLLMTASQLKKTTNSSFSEKVFTKALFRSSTPAETLLRQMPPIDELIALRNLDEESIEKKIWLQHELKNLGVPEAVMERIFSEKSPVLASRKL